MLGKCPISDITVFVVFFSLCLDTIPTGIHSPVFTENSSVLTKLYELTTTTTNTVYGKLRIR